MEAPLPYIEDWRKVIAELRAARKVIQCVKGAYNGKSFNVDVALDSIKKYDEARRG
jgi:hypothetical protein